MFLFIKKEQIKYIFIIICLLLLTIMAYQNYRIQKNTYGDMHDFSAKVGASTIEIQWNGANWNLLECVELTISDDDSIFEASVPPLKTSYSYDDAVHGKWYTVTAKSRFKDGSYGKEYSKSVLFFDYNKLPDIPLIVINTSDGLDPPYEKAVKPDENLCGESITNNKFVSGECIIRYPDSPNIVSGVKIRVRGNTSSWGGGKQSYKVVLNEAIDLLGRGRKFADKDWTLLIAGTNLNTYIGEYITELLDVEWHPKMMFVNVVLNGDWKGCYILIESVSKSEVRGNISKTGYIFENDAYFWNSNGIYFRLKYQHPGMGYTFKYPNIKNIKDPRFSQLQQFMSEYENYIISGDVRYKEYIDEESFAKWILVKDIMGEGDGVGSNMFFYKYDFDLDNPTSSKIKMGPLWDFDASFTTLEEWSYSRLGVGTYFPQLFGHSSFSNMYNSLFYSKTDTLISDIAEKLSELKYFQGESLDESWTLDAVRWEKSYVSLDEQINYDLEWLSKRIIWMNDKLENSPSL